MHHHHHHCSCGCACPDDLPEACWVPKRLPDVGSFARPGHHIHVKLAIANDADRSQTFTVSGSDPSLTVTPGALPLGPLERGYLKLRLQVPPGSSIHYLETCVVTVTGCSTYRFRWVVGVGPWRVAHAIGCKSAVRMVLDPDPVRIVERRDYGHDWYDHFFCDGPCPSSLAV